MPIKSIILGILNISPEVQKNAFDYIDSIFPENIIKSGEGKTISSFDLEDYYDEVNILRNVFSLYRKQGLILYFEDKAKTNSQICTLDYLILKKNLGHISYSLDFDMNDDIFHTIAEHYLSSDYTLDI